VVVLYKKIKKLSVDMKDFWIVAALFVQINIISVIAVLGNNTGRYFYIVTPLIIFYIVKELSAVIPRHEKEAATATT
jgi:hypothetical protein